MRRHEQGRTEPETVCADVEIRLHGVGLDPADGEHDGVRRQHRAPSFHDLRRNGLGGEKLDRVGACLQGREGLRRRRDPGRADHAEILRPPDHRHIGMGHDDQLAAHVEDAIDVLRVDDRSGPDEHVVGQGRAPGFRMLLKGSGELSGTSMMRKPASTRAYPTLSAFSGRSPRRIATSGRSARYSRGTSEILQRQFSERRRSPTASHCRPPRDRFQPCAAAPCATSSAFD